jgi:hypothetical protein
VLNAAANLNIASAGDLSSALAQITAVPIAAISTVQQFTGLATQAVSDASRIVGAVRGLQGFHGRFANGALATMQAANATASSALSAATTARSTVFAAADLVNRTASLL